MELKVDNESIEKLVQQHIRIAVIQALNGKADYLVARVVEEALKKPSDNHYARNTVIEELTDQMIAKAANEAAQEWLEEQRPKVKKLVYAALTKKTDGLVAAIAEQLTIGLEKGIDVSVVMKGQRQY